jgi:hypothetical protein
MEGQKFWHVKEVRAANVRQAKRYAERWCAAWLLPDLPRREAVVVFTAKRNILRSELKQDQRLREAEEAACTMVKKSLVN